MAQRSFSLRVVFTNRVTYYAGLKLDTQALVPGHQQNNSIVPDESDTGNQSTTRPCVYMYIVMKLQIELAQYPRCVPWFEIEKQSTCSVRMCIFNKDACSSINNSKGQSGTASNATPS